MLGEGSSPFRMIQRSGCRAETRAYLPTPDPGLSPLPGASFAWGSASQSCLTLRDPVDCSPPGSSVRGVSCPFLVPGSSPTQGSSPGLLRCRPTLSHCTAWRPLGESWPGRPEGRRDAADPRDARFRSVSFMRMS